MALGAYKARLAVVWLLLSAAPDSAADNIERYEKGQILLQNMSPGVSYLGQAVSQHMRTANSYSIRGWNHRGNALLFSYRGDLYQSKGPRSQFTKLIDFDQIDIKGVQKAKVCGAEGYVFTDDEDGDEYSAVYATDGRAFKPIQLSVGTARNISLRVANAGGVLAYASAQKNTGRWQLFVQELCQPGKRQELYAGEIPLYPRDFHPTDSFLLSTAQAANGFALYEWDLTTGQRRTLVQTDMAVKQAVYSASGQYVFYTTNAESEFIELYRLDRDTGETIRVLSDLGMDIERLRLSPNREKMAVSLNHSGLSRLLVIDTVKLKLLVPPSKLSLGVISALYFEPDGVHLAVRLSQPTVPTRSGLYNYQTDQFEPWSGGFVPGQELIDLIPSVTSYPTYDRVNGKRRQIPMLYYRPDNASPEKPAAVVIAPHGGPESQSRPSFNRLYHYYVSKLGIAVIRPNIRGSTGYGKTFELLDETIRRQDAIKDIGALLDWIGRQPELDAQRVAIAGGSYGGYVALASLAAYPERFRGGISRFGVTDFTTFLEHTEPYRLANRRQEYGDERIPEVRNFFAGISPLYNAGKIRQPVLVIQGANDPRVPQQQAEDMIKAMRNAKVEVSYLLAKDEGHGFKKTRNKRFSDGAQIAFLQRILGLKRD